MLKIGIEKKAYPGVTGVVHSRSLEVCERLRAVDSRVNGSNHPGVAVRAGEKLLAVEPYRHGSVSDGEVPLRETISKTRRDEDVS